MPETDGTGTVYIVDDDERMRLSMVSVMEMAAIDVESFPDAASLLAAHALRRPGCVLMDLRMPRMSGIEALEALRARGEHIPVILITGYGDVDSAVRAMKAGAADFLMKPVRPKPLLAIVRDCLKKDRSACRIDMGLQELRQRMGSLTVREREVMRLVVDGASNKVVARELAVSPRTVEHHRAHMMQKLGAQSLADLVQMAGLLERSRQSAASPTLS